MQLFGPAQVKTVHKKPAYSFQANCSSWPPWPWVSEQAGTENECTNDYLCTATLNTFKRPNRQKKKELALFHQSSSIAEFCGIRILRTILVRHSDAPPRNTGNRQETSKAASTSTGSLSLSVCLPGGRAYTAAEWLTLSTPSCTTSSGCHLLQLKMNLRR